MLCAMILHDGYWSIIDKVTDHFNVTLSIFIPYFFPIHDVEWRNFHEIRSIICNWHIEVIVPRKRKPLKWNGLQYMPTFENFKETVTTNSLCHAKV